MTRGWKKGDTMKHSIRGYAFLISIIVLTCLFISGRKVDVALRTPQRYVCTFDDALSTIKQSEIQSCVDAIDKKIALKPAKLVAFLRDQFPLVKAIRTRLVPPGIMELTFSIAKPICRINDGSVVVPPKTLCPTCWYQEPHFVSLPVLLCDEFVLKTIDPLKLVWVINQIPHDAFEHYTVALKTDDELQLVDKTEPRLSLVCRVNKIPTEHLCEYGATVKEVLASRGVFASRNNKQWLADLRFEKQIILSKR